MNTIPDELLAIARRCADRLALSKRRGVPALEDLEEQCVEGIEELLSVLQDDDVIGEVDLSEQQTILDRIEAALPEASRPLVNELSELHTRQVWLQQEAAYYLGLAVGLKMARNAPHGDEDVDDDTDGLSEDDEEG